MNPTESATIELRKFNANKSKWTNAKCSEINDFFIAATQQQHQHPHQNPSTISNYTILNASARLLCMGPKFNEQQAQELTTYLQRMQTIFIDTQICLPKQFDICRNLDRIWEFTYVSSTGNDNDLNRLDLTAVAPLISYAIFQVYSISIFIRVHFKIKEKFLFKKFKFFFYFFAENNKQNYNYTMVPVHPIII